MVDQDGTTAREVQGTGAGLQLSSMVRYLCEVPRRCGTPAVAWASKRMRRFREVKTGNVVLGTRQECEDFVRGLCFMATGGGGSPEVGLKALLDQLEAGRNIEWP